MEDLTARTGCGSTCGCCREYAVEALQQAHAMPLRLPVAASTEQKSIRVYPPRGSTREALSHS